MDCSLIFGKIIFKSYGFMVTNLVKLNSKLKLENKQKFKLKLEKLEIRNLNLKLKAKLQAKRTPTIKPEVKPKSNT